MYELRYRAAVEPTLCDGTVNWDLAGQFAPCVEIFAPSPSNRFLPFLQYARNDRRLTAYAFPPPSSRLCTGATEKRPYLATEYLSALSFVSSRKTQKIEKEFHEIAP
jgi:hypothetical protein